jgi:hypothetical protein
MVLVPFKNRSNLNLFTVLITQKEGALLRHPPAIKFKGAFSGADELESNI